MERCARAEPLSPRDDNCAETDGQDGFVRTLPAAARHLPADRPSPTPLPPSHNYTFITLRWLGRVCPWVHAEQTRVAQGREPPPSDAAGHRRAPARDGRAVAQGPSRCSYCCFARSRDEMMVYLCCMCVCVWFVVYTVLLEKWSHKTTWRCSLVEISVRVVLSPGFSAGFKFISCEFCNGRRGGALGAGWGVTINAFASQHFSPRRRPPHLSVHFHSENQACDPAVCLRKNVRR